MQPLRLSSILHTCPHACPVHRPADPASNLADVFTQVGAAARSAVHPLQAALQPPALGSITRAQGLLVIWVVMLATVMAYQPFGAIALAGTAVNLTAVWWVSTRPY